MSTPSSGTPLELPEEGDAVPDLALPDSSGGRFSIADHRGGWLVLYFYPRDNTSGCTREAEDFTRLLGDFDLLGARVVGVSPDSIESHRRFIRSRDLGVSLVSDHEGRLIRACGASSEPGSGEGRPKIQRSTLLIDPEGRVARAWRKVRVAGHAEDVLETLRAILEKRTDPKAGAGDW